MFFAVRFTLSKSSPPVTNATHLRTFCFIEFIQYACREIFVNQHVLLLLDLHWNSRKLPWRMQRICEPFVLKTIIMPFERLFVLWHPLIRSLSFIQVYIVIPGIHFAPFLRLSHILLYTNFFTCTLPHEIYIFFIPDDAVDRQKLGI